MFKNSKKPTLTLISSETPMWLRSQSSIVRCVADLWLSLNVIHTFKKHDQLPEIGYFSRYCGCARVFLWLWPSCIPHNQGTNTPKQIISISNAFHQRLTTVPAFPFLFLTLYHHIEQCQSLIPRTCCSGGLARVDCMSLCSCLVDVCL